MKAILGILLMVAGVVFGLYAGLWWAFIGGIVDVIHAIRAPELVAMDVAIGVLKVMFAGLIGGVSALVLVIPGHTLLENS